ncbi:DUF4169 family protein [Pararhodobacter zhoushanensis]|uniref:DUF4169 family protein n=1 Tax=Pararhodobacter zhoushanensis TaxID=2479545 RepID=UPI000F8CEA8A|nr:DUF4169 family protein [Pararhodobacter zhoushanensis]
MAKVINLRTRRKQAARDEGRAQGAVSAAKHGVSKAQASLEAARTEKARRELDGHQREQE